MVIDGKKIAGEIKEELKREIKKLGEKPRLSIIYVGSDLAIESFIKIKKRFGEEIGVDVQIHKFSESVSEEELKKEIESRSEESNGVIIQLPLPENFDTDKILNVIPVEKDVDVLSQKTNEAQSASRNKILFLKKTLWIPGRHQV